MNFDQLEGVGLLRGRRTTVRGGRWGEPLAAPRAPPAPPAPLRLRGPGAPARWSQPRRLGGRGDSRGLGAGSRAQHCHYLTQQEQCWGELRAEARDVIGS